MFNLVSTFLPHFTINNVKLDGGSFAVNINGKHYPGVVSINHSFNHESGKVYGTGGKLTGFTRGIFRGGSGNITLFKEDFNEFFNSNASDTINFMRQTYDIVVTYEKLGFANEALSILNCKFNNVSEAYQSDSADALVVDCSFDFINIQDKLQSAIAETVINTVRSFI